MWHAGMTLDGGQVASKYVTLGCAYPTTATRLQA